MEKIRRLKVDLVIQVYCGDGPFWQKIHRARTTWGIEADDRLPPTRSTLPILPPPRLSRAIAKDDPKRQDLEKLRASIRTRKKGWSTYVRALWESVIPSEYREASDWDKFTAACMLYDPPERQIDEFAEYGGLKPEGLSATLRAKDPGEVSEAWEDLYRGTIEELGRRYFAPDGQDVWQWVSIVYSETDLMEKFAARMGEAPTIRTKPERGLGGAPPRDKALAIKCAALYHDHNYKDPQKKGRWHWTYESLVDELGLDKAEQARKVNKKDPKERERRRAIGESWVKAGDKFREKHKKLGGLGLTQEPSEWWDS